MTPYFQNEPKIFGRKANKFIYPYLEVWYNGKRSRLHIGCKVRASQWCAERHRAYISQFHSHIDNFNNETANREIEACISRYMTFISYLCCNPTKIDNFHAEFQQYMGRPKKQPQQQPKQIDVFKIIEDAVNATSLVQETKDNYNNKGLVALKAFSKFRELPIDNFEMINADLMYEFAEFVNNRDNYPQPNGEPYTMASVNSIIKCGVSAIKCLPVKYLSKEKAMTLEARQFPDKTSPANKIALLDKDILKLWKYQPTNKRDEEIRDMFLVLCLIGQRVEDLPKINGGIKEEDCGLYLNIVQDKGSNEIKVDVLFPLLGEILNKYSELPKFNKYYKDKINRNIKRIAKEAGIEGKVIQSIHYQGEPKPRVAEVERTSLIASHTGRRTFVTILSIHGWGHQRISDYSGHQDIDMVKHYDKSTPYDRRVYKLSKPEERVMTFEEIDELSQSTPKYQQPTAPTAQKPNRFPNSVQEAKEVLQLLGVETISNDIGELLGFIMLRETEILERCGGKIDILRIKDLFNTKIPLESRCTAFKVLLNGLKAQ